MSADFNVEDIFMGSVTVGERGQIVIPADARKKLDIHTGDRLIAVCNPQKNGIAFLKLDTIREIVNTVASKLDSLEGNLQDSIDNSINKIENE